MRIERRLRQPWWLTVVVPVVSIAVALVLSGFVLFLTGHPPLKSLHRILDAAFIANGALTETVISATPLAFTGLAAAVAFRMNLLTSAARDSSTRARSPGRPSVCSWRAHRRRSSSRG